jgi:hypothetical protein
VQRYFFHTADGDVFRDLVGTELPSEDAARIEAARVLGQLVHERPADVWRDDDFRITVTDEADLILFTIDVAAVVAPAAGFTGPKPSGRGES